MNDISNKNLYVSIYLWGENVDYYDNTFEAHDFITLTLELKSIDRYEKDLLLWTERSEKDYGDKYIDIEVFK